MKDEKEKKNDDYEALKAKNLFIFVLFSLVSHDSFCDFKSSRIMSCIEECNILDHKL